MKPRDLVLAAAMMGAVALPSEAATYLVESLLLTTDGRRSTVASDSALTVNRTVRMVESWNAASPVLGGITTTTDENPLYEAWQFCKKLDVLNTGGCGRAPARTITTRTGATAQFSTSGQAGFEVNASLAAGSIAPELAYDVGFFVPEAGELPAGEAWDLAPQFELQSGEVNLRSATATVRADFVLGVQTQGSATVCYVAGCDSYNLDLPDVAYAQKELVEVNPNSIEFLGGVLPAGYAPRLPLANLRADINVGALPPYANVTFSNPLIPDLPGTINGPTIDVGNVETNVPQYEVEGSLGADGVLRASGRDDVLDLRADIDALAAALLPGAPPPGGVKLTAGPLNVSVNAWDIEGGPSVDLFQDVQITPKTLLTLLIFDRPVRIDGLGSVTNWLGELAKLPAIIFDGVTTVTPRYYAEAAVRSVAGLQFGLELGIDVLKAKVSALVLNREFGPLKSYDYAYNPEFLKATFFDSSFNLGFYSVQGQSFVVNAVAPPPATIPLPASGVLLAFGLVGLGGACRFRR